MSTLNLAWRNLRRNRRRSLITLLALITGTVSLLMFAGYVSDTVQGLQTVTIRSIGHLEVVPDGYLSFGRGDPGHFSIRNYTDLIQRIRSDAELAPMLAAVAPTLNIEGIAGTADDNATSANFLGEAWWPADRRKLLAWDGLGLGIPPGRSGLLDDRPDAGVVGFGMAQLLGLCDTLQVADCRRFPEKPGPAAAGAALSSDLAELSHRESAHAPPDAGATVNLLAASPAGLPNVVRMQVLRVDRQAIRDIDNMYVAMPLELGQRLVFGPGERAVSAIVIQLRSTTMLDAAAARLRRIVADTAPGQALEVVSFHEVNPVYDQIVDNYRTIFTFISILIATVTLFSVANTMNMAVSERTAEIGMLRALGFGRRFVRTTFIYEGLLLGLLGTCVGTAIAIGLSEGFINLAGLSWTPPGRSQPIPIHVAIFAVPSVIWLTAICLSSVACLSALWPANTAARLDITKALRHA